MPSARTGTPLEVNLVQAVRLGAAGRACTRVRMVCACGPRTTRS